MVPSEVFVGILGGVVELYALYLGLFARDVDPETDPVPLSQFRRLATLRALKRGERYLVALHQSDGGVLAAQSAPTRRRAFRLASRAFRKSGHVRAYFEVNSLGAATLAPAPGRIRWLKRRRPVGYVSLRIEPI